MIVFDTNVISEIIKSDCNDNVLRWLKASKGQIAFTTTVNLAELLSGVAVMPNGRRKTEPHNSIAEFIEEFFEDNILVFDTAAARIFSTLIADMKSRGRAISFPDCQIAAIALANNYAIATRDVQPFLDAGVKVVNPWADE